MNKSYSFLREAEEDAKIEINYDALIDLSKKEFGTPEEEVLNKDSIVFYCKDCKQIVEAERLPSPSKKPKVQFCCSICKGRKVFYGTQRGLEKFFHIK